MSVFYLISIIIGVASQNIVKKPFTQKTAGRGMYFFGLLASLAAMLFFVATAKGFEWNAGLIVYAVFFALSYATSTVCSVAAVAYGSLSLTSLITSYSLMLPTLYGLIFLNDPISFGLFPGLVLLVISLFLINQTDTGSPINYKWLVYVLLAFIGNGMCSVSQKMQQDAFDGAYKNEFMILALAIVVILLGVLVLTKERRDVKVSVKSGWHLALVCGVMNGIVNMFVMILSNIMPVSLMFPLISAGGIIITYIVSKCFYKEEFTKKQLVGFFIGVLSVVFLNI